MKIDSTRLNSTLSNCSQKEQPEEAETLGLSNLGGVFIVLGGGVLVAVITAIFEQLFYVWSVSKEEEVSFRRKMCERVRNAIR